MESTTCHRRKESIKRKITGRIRELEIETFGQDVTVTITPESIHGDLQHYRVTVDFAAPVVPEKIRIRWLEPFVDMLSTWTANNRDRSLYADWRPMRTYSRSAAGAPILSLVGRDGTNSCTIAVADAATPLMLSAGISERKGDCYCVPQISVLFDRLPSEHEKMLKYYLKFIDDHRHILLDGELILQGVEGAYSQVWAKADGKAIATAYNSPLLKLDEAHETLTVANGSGSAEIYLENCTGALCYTYEIVNCMGESVEQGEVRLADGSITKFAVPVCGFLHLSKM